MVQWFWYFMSYSLIGFVLEVLFARVTHHPKRDRKCLYFLPLCPVYGLGAIAILLLPEEILSRPLLLLPCAAVVATAVEYFVGLFYERVALVSFWNYSAFPWNIGGKVCLLFTAFWGVLGLGLYYGVHPLVAELVSAIPTAWSIPAVLFLALDVGFTIVLLRRERTTEALRWYRRVTASAGAPHRHG